MDDQTSGISQTSLTKRLSTIRFLLPGSAACDSITIPPVSIFQESETTKAPCIFQSSLKCSIKNRTTKMFLCKDSGTEKSKEYYISRLVLNSEMNYIEPKCYKINKLKIRKTTMKKTKISIYPQNKIQSNPIKISLQSTKNLLTPKMLKSKKNEIYYNSFY